MKFLFWYWNLSDWRFRIGEFDGYYRIDVGPFAFAYYLTPKNRIW